MCPPEASVCAGGRGSGQKLQILDLHAPSDLACLSETDYPLGRVKTGSIAGNPRQMTVTAVPKASVSVNCVGIKKKYKPRLIKEMSPEARERCRAKNRRASARYRQKKPRVKKQDSPQSVDSEGSVSAATAIASMEVDRVRSIRDSKLAVQAAIKLRLEKAAVQLAEIRHLLAQSNEQEVSLSACTSAGCLRSNITAGAVTDEPVWPFDKPVQDQVQDHSDEGVDVTPAVCEAFAVEQLQHNLKAVHLLRTDLLLKMDQYSSSPYSAIGCAQPIDLKATVADAVQTAAAALGAQDGNMGALLLQSTSMAWNALSAGILSLRNAAGYTTHEPPPPGPELSNVFDDLSAFDLLGTKGRQANMMSALDYGKSTARTEMGVTLNSMFEAVLDESDLEDDDPASNLSLQTTLECSHFQERITATADPCLPLVDHALRALGAISADEHFASVLSVGSGRASLTSSGTNLHSRYTDSLDSCRPSSGTYHVDAHGAQSVVELMAPGSLQTVFPEQQRRDSHADLLMRDLAVLRAERMRSERILVMAPASLLASLRTVSAPGCLAPDQARTLAQRVLQGLNLTPRQVQFCRLLQQQYVQAIRAIGCKLTNVARLLDSLVSDVTVGDLMDMPGCATNYSRTLALYKSLQRDCLHNMLKLRRMFILRVLDPLQAARAQVFPLPYHEDVLQLIDMVCSE